jgi:organic radical activating enzyme
MLYKHEQHNFKKFITEWDTNSEYVLFGASKECVQFIRSLDYLLGENTLKIKYIVDHNIKNITTVDNINEISSFYRQSKSLDNTRKSIKLIQLDDFEELDAKVIITTDEFRNEYKKYLESKNVKYTSYKNIASIWPFEIQKKVHIFQTDILVTERCNLNCSHCNMFVPHYETPTHRNVDTIIQDVDLFFEKVDYVSILHLVGGEPFLYPNIDDVIKHIVSNYINKIDKFIITTNGTVTPKDSTIDLLKNNNVILSVSNYSDKLEKLRVKVTKNIENYKLHNIKHYVRDNIEWYDFGDLRVKKNLTDEELIEHFDSCTAPFRGLNNGKFYYCHLNTSAVLTKLFPSNENDYVTLSSVTQEELIRFDLGYTNLGYITFCDNCNGCNTGIKIPVSYEKQGTRTIGN